MALMTATLLFYFASPLKGAEVLTDRRCLQSPSSESKFFPIREDLVEQGLFLQKSLYLIPKVVIV